jgi:hypothetical protein
MGRPAYEQLPPGVRAAVDGLLGSPVVAAESQAGGWSPGVAARVRCADGSRAFVKAVSAEVDVHAPQLHRREAVVAAGLPTSLGSPRLLGSYELHPWVVLVLQDVEGREPVLPDDLPAVLATLDRLAEVPAPAALTTAAEALADDFGGWRRLAERGAPVDPWRTPTSAGSWPSRTGGRRPPRVIVLLHLDLRTDNMLLRPDGTVALVDWPWAAAGHPVFDLVGLLPSAVLSGAQDPERLLLSTPVGRAADPDAVTSLVAAVTGRMEEHARRPAPAALPTLRGFQAAQARVARAWLQERLA